MASSKIRDTIECSGSVAVTEIENGFKKDKIRAKANFTRTQNILLSLIDDDSSSHCQIIEAGKRLGSCLEIVLDILYNFSDFYTRQKEHTKCERILSEMGQIEEDFYSASKSAQQFLESRKDDSATLSATEMLTIDIGRGLNIADESSETVLKDHAPTEQAQETYKVQFSDQFRKINGPMPVQVKNTQTLYENQTNESNATDITNEQSNEHVTATSSGECDNTRNSTQINEQQSRTKISVMNARALPFEPSDNSYGRPSVPTANFESPSIGQDLWRQLKRVQIPVFSGDKRSYHSWKAAFLACIDSAPATGEYKLLQLRQYLSGEALKTIENLGHSGAAYEAAKERLERKFGGMPRQISIYIEELENFRQIRVGNAKDLEQFSDLLDIAMINLKESSQDQELGNGTLYTILQRKLPQSMLANYHRWVYDNNVTQSVATLRQWVILESEFQTVASETVHGVTGKMSDAQTTPPRQGQRNTRTFFGDSRHNRTKKTQCCQVCGADHQIWTCQVFKQKSISDKWDIAKRCQLCFRCLAEGHSGRKCPRSRQCGQNGCKALHHRLLHQPSQETELKTADLKSTNSIAVKASNEISSKQTTSDTEGNKPWQQTTMTANNVTTTDFIALRTVPIILKNGNLSIKVNALLDDASTKTYINADVAAELGLQGKTERVTVNVLNGQVETFETRPVDVQLESLIGDVKLQVTAYTATTLELCQPSIGRNTLSDGRTYSI